jgi:hypothetical protein
MKRSIFQHLKLASIFWLARRLPDCKTITPNLGESLDRKLSLREKIVMKLHFFTCSGCTRYLKQIKFLSEAMHIREERLTEGNDSFSAKMSAEAKDRLKDALKSTGFAI